MSENIIKIFYSYSRKDLEMRNTLGDHLATLREAKKIITWHDLQLEAGTEWEPAILNKLDTADIILLLVSRNFFASEFCYVTELKRAIARHNEGTARVIPIILSSCDWNHPDVPFSKLNVLPTHAKPIKSWTDPDDAFTIVAQKIRETVDQLRSKKQAEQQAEEQKGHSHSIIDLPPTPRKELKECDSAKILFIKNVKDPSGKWAYSLDRIEQPESRAFELMWRSGSHGVNLPKTGDLMILHQRAKVTHVVEFLDDQVRQTDSGVFRSVRAVWMPEQDWNQLPHQKDVLGFSPNYADGNTHSLNSPNFPTFRAVWSSLEEFQKHIFRHLTQSELNVIGEEILASKKGIDYTQLQNLLKAGKWKEADQETAKRMCEVMGRQKEDRLREEDIEQFPCADLRTIDRLWVKYSQGKFGFSVQKEIWQKFGNLENTQQGRFAEEVGWKEEEVSVNSNLRSYPEYTFDMSARKGHLPSRLYTGWDGRGIEFRDTRNATKWTQQVEYGMSIYDSVSFLARRLVKCKI